MFSGMPHLALQNAAFHSPKGRLSGCKRRSMGNALIFSDFCKSKEQ
jgi:hypothetical protein